MAFTVLACCKRHCSLYFLEPCWRVWGSGPRGLVFVFQATINALCAPAWRKNQSSRLPRQKGPVLSAENPDVNWPCQIPAREKKIHIFGQSKGGCHVGFWVSLLGPTGSEQWWLVNRSHLLSHGSPAFLDAFADEAIHYQFTTTTCPPLRNTRAYSPFLHQALPTGSPFSHQGHVNASSQINSIAHARVF